MEGEKINGKGERVICSEVQTMFSETTVHLDCKCMQIIRDYALGVI